MNTVLENLSHLMNHRKKLDSDGFNDLINKILCDYPSIGWELGHSLENPNITVLCLSAKNAEKFIEIFEASSSDLKIGNDWKIQIGLLPKDWDLFFEAKVENRLFEIEGKRWVWSYGEGARFDKLLLAPASAFPTTVSNQDIREIGEIILVGELGEINYLTYVKHFSVLAPPTQFEGWYEMNKLRIEFIKLNPTCHDANWLSKNFHV